MATDPERLALHAQLQAARGGRFLEDLSQPHWDRAPAARPPGREANESSASTEPTVPVRSDSSPSPPGDSYRELLELDRAQTVRRAEMRAEPVTLRADQLDIEILALIGTFGHLLSSQLHRRFNEGRSLSTTQRRLKRLADAGLVERLQFHRADGGGVPMCCALSPAGLALLEARGRPVVPSGTAAPDAPGEAALAGAALLAGVRRQVHVAGWTLALARLRPSARLRGSAGSVLAVPRMRQTQPPGPQHLMLPGGRTAHAFLRSDRRGERHEAERFETLRPDATICLHEQPHDILVHLQLRGGREKLIAMLERYDHFLSGWSAHTTRYSPSGGVGVTAVILCRDSDSARDTAMVADGVLSAARAYAGEPPSAWEYPGRRSLLFAAERDLHEGRLDALGVPALPPWIRAEQPAAGEQSGVPLQVRSILEPGPQRAT